MVRAGLLLTMLSLAACSSDGSSGPASGGAAGSGGSPSGGSAGVAAAGSDAGTTDASLGGAPSGGTSSGGTSSGGTSSGGTSSGGTGGAALMKGGSVTVTQAVAVISGTSYPSYSFSAGFADSISTASAGSCTTAKDGSCTIYTCSSPNPSADAGALPPQASAGTISLSGALEALTLTPKADGSYGFLGGSKLMWKDKAQLTLTASGGKVPGFSATLDGAGPLLVLTPNMGPATPLTLNRNQPFSLTWSGASVGTATVSLARSLQNAATTDSVSVSCTYPASAGAATIPTSTLLKIPAAGNGSINVYAGDQKQIIAGAWLVYVTEISGSNAASVTFM